jgi:hypothetical protein
MNADTPQTAVSTQSSTQWPPDLSLRQASSASAQLRQLATRLRYIRLNPVRLIRQRAICVETPKVSAIV